MKYVRYRRKKFTFAISSPDEFLYNKQTVVDCFHSFRRQQNAKEYLIRIRILQQNVRPKLNRQNMKNPGYAIVLTTVEIAILRRKLLITLLHPIHQIRASHQLIQQTPCYATTFTHCQ